MFPSGTRDRLASAHGPSGYFYKWAGRIFFFLIKKKQHTSKKTTPRTLESDRERRAGATGSCSGGLFCSRLEWALGSGGQLKSSFHNGAGLRGKNRFVIELRKEPWPPPCTQHKLSDLEPLWLLCCFGA
ncbi:cis-aconitate decarboxylase [Platysternon megacephalum]|uniref:Cis-aconitate decarboxylase n=1 Tax=Platysternon megacephalum TaxID=55544 RepID=A0A4D9E4F1_9SAUR|nr:cis-aconitate decarboxylase [Platysternon megacephalum]